MFVLVLLLFIFHKCENSKKKKISVLGSNTKPLDTETVYLQPSDKCDSRSGEAQKLVKYSIRVQSE